VQAERLCGIDGVHIRRSVTNPTLLFYAYKFEGLAKGLDMEIKFKHIIPPLTVDERAQLEQNILRDGIREPLVVWGDILIDGHNRLEIAQKYGLAYQTTNIDFTNESEAKEWIILNQFGRRNLPIFERARLALEMKPIVAEKAKENQGNRSDLTSGRILPNVETRKEIAAIAGVSHDTVSRVEKIIEHPEISERVKSGELSINQGYQMIRQAEKTNEIKQNIERQRAEIERIEEPVGLFDVIVIDPPWNYGTQYDAAGRRAANPYPEMTQAELLKLNLPSTENSIVFLWTTHRFIWDAKELLDHWGFEYRNIITWDKQKMGMGDLFRMQCEFCLVGIKGRPTLDNNHTYRDIIEEPRREHSRKPDAFYEMIDELCVGRKLDYFSRQQRNGWVSHGNDTGKF